MILLTFLCSVLALAWWRYLALVPEVIRDDGPTSHQSKTGVVTMGGVVIIALIVLYALIFCDRLISLPYVAALLGFGLLGAIDDMIKASCQPGRGFSMRAKFIGQWLLAVLLAEYLWWDQMGVVQCAMVWCFELSHPVFVALAALTIVSTVNAVNFTDGIDGLLTSQLLVVMLGLVLLGWLPVAHHLLVTGLVGILLGFMWWNAPPAKVFMGDVGAMALGAFLAVLFIQNGVALWLLVLGAVFVLEALSVIVQVFCFKCWRKRVFLMAPLHHHFELMGWSESQIVWRFLIFSTLILEAVMVVQSWNNF